MTLFEIMKTDAFDEMLMAKFLATVTIRVLMTLQMLWTLILKCFKQTQVFL